MRVKDILFYIFIISLCVFCVKYVYDRPYLYDSREGSTYVHLSGVPNHGIARVSGDGYYMVIASSQLTKVGVEFNLFSKRSGQHTWKIKEIWGDHGFWFHYCVRVD